MIDDARLYELARRVNMGEAWFTADDLDAFGIVDPNAAAFIAAADPPTVAGLLDEIKRLKSALENLNAAKAEPRAKFCAAGCGWARILSAFRNEMRPIPPDDLLSSIGYAVAYAQYKKCTELRPEILDAAEIRAIIRAALDEH